MSLFINYLVEDPFFFFAWVLVVVFSICIHEYAHAYTALRLGDDTAARAGHLTLNPLIQMGPTSLIFLALIGIAWGSVPVAINRFREPWAGAVVAFAGPASNLLLSLLFALALTIYLAVGGTSDEVFRFLQLGSVANGVLFVLNMLPAPMLDGWSVFSYFFPGLRRLGDQHGQMLSLLLIAAIFMTPLGGLIWGGGRLIAGLFIGLFGFLTGM